MEAEDHQHPSPPPPGDGEAEEGATTAAAAIPGPRPSFPSGRVKRIMKLDRDVSKVNSEALFLVSLSVDLFLGLLAEKAREAALGKRKKTIRVEHLRAAVRSHPPTRDFLLDCLPDPSAEEEEKKKKAGEAAAEKVQSRKAGKVAAPAPLPPGARRIDAFFHKASEIEAEGDGV